MIDPIEATTVGVLLSVIVALVGMVVRLFGSNRVDRQQFFDEGQRMRVENAKDRAEAEKKVREAEAEKDKAEQEADDERHKRRAAEEELSRLRRRYGIPEDS